MSLVLKEGMFITARGWNKKTFLEILCICGKYAWTKDQNGVLVTRDLNFTNWIEYVPPKEKVKIDCWLNVYPDGDCHGGHNSKLIAQGCAMKGCLGQFHVVGEL